VPVDTPGQQITILILFLPRLLLLGGGGQLLTTLKTILVGELTHLTISC